MRSPYDVIVRPIISEQSMEQTDIKKYAFEVPRDAGKIEIKRAVEKVFDVKVDKVNTLIVKGKTKRVGRNPAGRTSDWKKAVVRLTADSKTIEFFEGMV